VYKKRVIEIYKHLREAWDGKQRDDMGLEIELEAATAEENNIQQAVNVTEVILGCNYKMLFHLPGEWGKWTGNTHPHTEAIVAQNKMASTTFGGEALKIPFKPSAWHKFRKEGGAGGAAANPSASTAAAGELGSGGGTQYHHDADGRLMHTTTGAMGTAASSTYGPGDSTMAGAAAGGAISGLTRYQAQRHPPGLYWAGLTLTECLIASPFYQHLPSEKFAALEKIASLRTFEDKEVITEVDQKVYSLMFIR
jgi:hypothetical protein